MNDIIEQVEACTNLIELNEIWRKYEHIDEIRKAILTKTTQILLNLN